MSKYFRGSTLSRSYSDSLLFCVSVVVVVVIVVVVVEFHSMPE